MTTSPVEPSASASASAPPVVVSVRIAAMPDVVFPYFTEPMLMTKWFAEVAELDPRPGGVFAVDIRDGTRPVRGAFVEVDPPHRIAFTWGVPGDSTLPAGSTTVEVVLVPDGDDTIVTLTHRDLPVPEAESHREGWTHFLGELAETAGSAQAG
jgi:uncharacterized protein YndB with AHSA1/START domain